MADEDDRTVDDLILERLEHANLPETASDLVLAALVGRAELDAAIGGAPPARPPRPSGGTASRGDPIGTYLTHITVQGFRGIGPEATIELRPGPGLTIVTGRNGSGKSSFAEAAELALTGDNKRWSAPRTAIWREGWRNLHSGDAPGIELGLAIDGHRDGATVKCLWADGSTADGCRQTLELAGRSPQPVDALGWASPLELYRPFLSYSELGGLLTGAPSQMYDAMQRILGLGRLVEIESMLKDARKAMDDLRKLADAGLPALRAELREHPDRRARQADELLAKRGPDLDALDKLAEAEEPADGGPTGLLRQLDVCEPPGRERVEQLAVRLAEALATLHDLAGTPAAEDRAVAELLRAALEHHGRYGDRPCPVCAGRLLDDGWAGSAREQLTRLTERAERVETAHRETEAVCAELRELLGPMPTALDGSAADRLAAEGVDTTAARAAWQVWDGSVHGGDPAGIAAAVLPAYEAVIAALAPVRDAARAALHRRAQAWQPLAVRLAAWTATARDSRRAAARYADLQKVVKWLHDEGEEIRNDRLAPVAGAASRIWNALRQGSSVELGTIKLTGAGPRRQVHLPVTVDGVEAAAQGVMSQGELHSLALALFLPRATMPASPFRFLVIDDPVQSMDPAKVYGLAKVLHEVARDRQVIVFTHDDRLPAAVRHLQLSGARVITVSRLGNSVVKVITHDRGDPVLRYLDDARAVAKDDKLDGGLRARVVCTLLRDALECAAHEVVWRRAARAGTPVADTEEALSEVEGLRQALALALLGDRRQAGEELDRRLDGIDRNAGWTVGSVNAGAHGRPYGGPRLDVLIDNAKRLSQRIDRS